MLIGDELSNSFITWDWGVTSAETETDSLRTKTGVDKFDILSYSSDGPYIFYDISITLEA